MRLLKFLLPKATAQRETNCGNQVVEIVGKGGERKYLEPNKNDLFFPMFDRDHKMSWKIIFYLPYLSWHEIELFSKKKKF